MAWIDFLNGKIEFEWDFGRKAKHWPSIGFCFAGEEEDYRLFLAAPGAQVFLTIRDHLLPRFWNKNEPGLRWYASRRTEITFHHNTLWFHFCDPEFDGGEECKYKWIPRCWSLNFEDLIFGESRRLSRVESITVLPAGLPEGVYSCVVEEESETWVWPRFRRSRHTTLWNVTPKRPIPIPIPGKGENAWDCDEDAIYEMSMRDADDARHAVDLLVEDVLDTRCRRGGEDWKPFSEYHREAIQANESS